ncbi:chemotaxis protein CheB [Thiocapsa marina]|uniref:protein-glutamate O-methyltransferase n=1 Tax=Thiocapsa marina 5811 TaxID=768671 RepID=F9U5D5_9GAMM|nr:chemotaxis protein CheB [Thiocapsa marina]EGV20358.1 MCP methyltransferase/methylesterase, CheR/CheB with PAS/PAC sensor [Thiocapsa marina 5811]
MSPDPQASRNTAPPEPVSEPSQDPSSTAENGAGEHDSSAEPKRGEHDNPPDRDPEAERGVYPIVGIGASAGGLDAFRSLLHHLPTRTGMAFALIQHLDPAHPSLLVDLLGRATRMPVREAVDGESVEPDHVYVIPPDCSLGLHHRRLLVLARREERGLHLPVDTFLQTLADDLGPRAIGVVLSGTGSDGTLGLKAIKAAGGMTFAQDERSAEHFGMPGSAIAAGCVDLVLAPPEMASELARIARHPYLRQPARTIAQLPGGNEEDLGRIFMMLRTRTGNDFSFYKRDTILRRIRRRMAVHRIDRLAEYVRYLQSEPEEVSRLFDDLLISVTGFFREPEAFDALREKVFPVLFAEPDAERPVRVWVPGCATGEEAYSIAIAMLESLGERAAGTRIQIFGTDIDPKAIEKARAGLFADPLVAHLTPEQLKRFFVKAPGGFEVAKRVRDLCIFAVQNLVKDPPFSRLDLVSCRNLMIYFGPPLQKQALQIFHYALEPNRFLMLGSSESIGARADLFALLDQKSKIYTKKSNAPRLDPALMPRAFQAPGDARVVAPARGVNEPIDLTEATDRMILKHYGPPGVVISGDLDILLFRGETGRYLDPIPGAATLNLLKLARRELAVELRTAIQEARTSGSAVNKRRVWYRRNGTDAWVGLRVLPIDDGGSPDRLLVLFDETASAEPGSVPAPDATSEPTMPVDERIVALERELTSTRDYLQSIIAEQERNNEQLKSANEEIQSANEELQSTIEELETAKEELQSTNEELATVNCELENRNNDLAEANSDLGNLLASVRLPVLILGEDLRIRQFTPQAERLLNLIASDLGRPIGNIKPNIEIPDLEARVQAVIDRVTPQTLEIQDKDGHWYSVRIRPYKSAENRIEGAVIAFVDVDEVKRSERLRNALGQEQRLAVLVKDADDAMTVQGFDGSIRAWNPAAERIYGYRKSDALAMSIERLIPPEAMELHRTTIERLQRGERVEPFESARLHADGRRLSVLIHPTALLDTHGNPYALATTERPANPPGGQTPSGGQAPPGGQAP